MPTIFSCRTIQSCMRKICFLRGNLYEWKIYNCMFFAYSVIYAFPWHCMLFSLFMFKFGIIVFIECIRAFYIIIFLSKRVIYTNEMRTQMKIMSYGLGGFSILGKSEKQILIFDFEARISQLFGEVRCELCRIWLFIFLKISKITAVYSGIKRNSDNNLPVVQ